MNKSLRTIAIDLTSVLPGEENCESNTFILELLPQLSKMAPQTQFVLLTQAASHNELAVLDQLNMRRQMVVGPIGTNSLRYHLARIVHRIISFLPIRPQSILNHLSYKLKMRLKLSRSGTLMSDISADLLYCPFTAPNYFEPGIPTVCTIFNLQHKNYAEFFNLDQVMQNDNIFMEACRRATALSAMSNYLRDTAIVHGNLDPQRIRTIYLRRENHFLFKTENDNRILKLLGLKQYRYLFYPANFLKHKNHEMLITAFGMACQIGLSKDIKLVLTGTPGEGLDWLMSAVNAMNLGDRVIFPGHLPNNEIAALMANCLGVVFPSLYEDFCLPVIEAMAVGVPVACSNTTSLPEVAADAAILFDPRIPTEITKAFIILAEDEKLRTRHIETGRKRAIEFSDNERMAREYLELFQYALTSEKQINLLTGVYNDGWAGPFIEIHTAPALSAQTLEIEFSALKWLPHTRLSIQAIHGGKNHGLPIKLDRGTNIVLSLPIESTGDWYKLRISPTFVPAQLSHCDDQRELSAMIKRCRIVRGNGEFVDLFPEKSPE